MKGSSVTRAAWPGSLRPSSAQGIARMTTSRTSPNVRFACNCVTSRCSPSTVVNCETRRRPFSSAARAKQAAVAAGIDSTTIRPLLSGLPYRDKFNRYKPPDMAVDHLVVGGGVVGLAIAHALAKRWPEKTTYLVERHTGVGMETSSRNSEVIHAGLYYPSDSFKTRFCLRGRELMYDLCKKEGIPSKQTGKLVVGPESSVKYFQDLEKHCKSLPTTFDFFGGESSTIATRASGGVQLKRPPVRLISGDEARQLEPNLSSSISHALLSERTGIVDSHELMAYLHRELDEACEGAEVVLDTSVVRVDPVRKDTSISNAANSGKRGLDKSNEGFVVQTVTGDPTECSGSEAADSILARVLINASGLNAPLVLNSWMLEGTTPGSAAEHAARQSLIPMWYSKGNYASYKGRGVEGIEHLIYPVPFMGHAKEGKSSGKHGHQSLGTHLTLDLAGNIKFGPDTEWLSAPSDGSMSEEALVDFWASRLAPPGEDDPRLDKMYDDVTTYLPNITRPGLKPDYAGIRPKLVGPGGGFMDFTFLYHPSTSNGRSPSTGAALNPEALWSKSIPTEAQGGGLMISLLGFESPGLTSSLAIGEYVREKIAAEVWGDHNRSKHKGAQSEEVGGLDLDAWA